MIIVAGTMTLDPAQIEAFERDVAAMLPAVRAEAGCLHYSLLVEHAPTGLVNVLEQWTDDAALLVHLRQPWILGFLGRHGPHVRSSTVQVFDIAAVRPLPASADA